MTDEFKTDLLIQSLNTMMNSTIKMDKVSDDLRGGKINVKQYEFTFERAKTDFNMSTFQFLNVVKCIVRDQLRTEHMVKIEEIDNE